MRTRFGRSGLVLTAAVAVVLAGSATAWAVAWDNVKPVVDSGKSTSGLQKLAWSASNLAPVDAAVADGSLSSDGGPGLAQVYSHTNQQMYYKSASQCSAAKAAISAADARYTLAAWCFSGPDETSDAWVPQAVTSSQDAQQQAGYAAGGDEIVGLWRQAANTGNRGRCTGVPDDPDRSVNLRATFIQRPYTDGTHSAYRHVLLVAPTGNGNVIAPICDVHGGGAVWYGPYLFVSWHGAGLKVFDTRRTYKIPYDTTCGSGGAAPGVNDIGVVGGRVCAAGYRYVMVQIGQFATTPSGCSTTPASLNAGLCFSGISLQWSDNSIVSSEYRNPADMTASGVPVRIVNWPTGDLLDRIASGSATPVTATKLATTNFEGVQGVVERPNATSGRAEFFVSRTVPGNDSSELWYEHDGDGVCAARGVYVNNAEQISYWVDSDGNGHLWTFTEYANRRMLVRIYTNEYNNAPSGCPTQ